MKPRMTVGELTQGSIGALSWREAEGREAERKGLRRIKGLPWRDQPFPGIHASDNMLWCDSDECRREEEVKGFCLISGRIQQRGCYQERGAVWPSSCYQGC